MNYRQGTGPSFTFCIRLGAYQRLRGVLHGRLSTHAPKSGAKPCDSGLTPSTLCATCVTLWKAGWDMRPISWITPRRRTIFWPIYPICGNVGRPIGLLARNPGQSKIFWRSSMTGLTKPSQQFPVGAGVRLQSRQLWSEFRGAIWRFQLPLPMAMGASSSWLRKAFLPVVIIPGVAFWRRLIFALLKLAAQGGSWQGLFGFRVTTLSRNWKILWRGPCCHI